MRRVLRSLRRAVEHGDDLDARSDMSFAALLGGLALANAGLGAVHGFAAPIGGAFPAPHGAVCAALLPHVIRVNVSALRSRAPESDALRRYRSLDLDAIAQLCADLRVPPLRTYGIEESDIPGLCAEAARASSMKANPIPLEAVELDEILRGAL
jgi:alcohol dehydrogenase class IV